MTHVIRVALYVVAIAAALAFGSLAYSHYSRLMADNMKEDTTDATDVKIPNYQQPAKSPYKYSRMMTYGALFVVSVIGLGLMVGHDFSHFVASRFSKVLHNDEGDAMNTQYEDAEKLWADGKHLEAIQLFRDYLKNNPREQHVALRIAEIYERDLHNPLAAALEYEEVLKHKLPPEQWGWTAIHLCNIYSSKLDQKQKAIDLLHRIAAEHPETEAAEKARKRLGLEEPEFESAQDGSSEAEEEEASSGRFVISEEDLAEMEGGNIMGPEVEAEPEPEPVSESTPAPPPVPKNPKPPMPVNNSNLLAHFNRFHKTTPPENNGNESGDQGKSS